MHVVVVGAGVVGVSSAWYLAQAGMQVTLLDRNSEAAEETSFANGGQISVSHAEPWATPHTPLMALRWLGREDAPLLFRPRLDREIAGWSLRFLRECMPSRTEANIRAILALALYSRSRLQALRGVLTEHGGIDYEHRQQGILHVYSKSADFARAQRAAAHMRELGCNRRTVSVDELVAIEPALASAAHTLVGGDYTAEDESGDAMKFTRGLLAHCRRAQVSVKLGQRVSDMSVDRNGVRIRHLPTADASPERDSATQELKADALVVAAGCYSRALLRPFGVDLPIVPAKGYSATLELTTGSIAPEVSLTDDEHKIVMSRFGQRLRIAGTAEFSGYDLSLNPTRCEAILKRTQKLFPQLSFTGDPLYWAGLRPSTPSNVPLIGKLSPAACHGRVWVNSGHGTLGWTLACGSGAALADLMAGRLPTPAFPFLGHAV